MIGKVRTVVLVIILALVLGIPVVGALAALIQALR
jgi:hypothetical protein